MDSDDFVKDFEYQWHEQVERAKHQTVAQRLQYISGQIQAFENHYGGTFEKLFGHRIDGMSEAVDITDWKELLEERKRLMDMTLAMNRVIFIQANEFDEIFSDDAYPSGVFAVSPDPNQPRVMVRKLVDWCRANGLPLSEVHRLSPEVMQQFLVYPTKDGEQKKKRE